MKMMSYVSVWPMKVFIVTKVVVDLDMTSEWMIVLGGVLCLAFVWYEHYIGIGTIEIVVWALYWY